MTALVLSCFPGLDMLGMAFEQEGYCVVHGPDVIFGRDVRAFHPPAGRFDGLIGGDPCQAHSTLANLVRAKGLEPRFGDMTGEYARVVEEARPAWFLRENVPGAPDIAPAGYSVTSFLLDNAWLDAGDGLGEEQMRKRRFWFGWPAERGPAPNLMRWIRLAVFELPVGHLAVTADAREVPVALGGSGRTKRTAAKAVTGRHDGEIGTTGGHRGSPGRYSLAEMVALQGLPPDTLEHSPFTMSAKRRLIGNGVPIPLGRALARAVRCATETPRPRTVRERDATATETAPQGQEGERSSNS